jgi:hypothetical protein
MHSTQQRLNPSCITNVTQQLQQQRINPIQQRNTRSAADPA